MILTHLLQLWLIFSGKVIKPWDDDTVWSFTDLSGNKLSLPATATMSMTFSCISMFKAVIELNIFRIHIDDVDDTIKLKQLVGHILNHLAFFSSCLFFRLCSFALFLTYLSAPFGLFPVAIFWVFNVGIGYCKFESKDAPLWLTSFISAFFPLYCSMKAVKTQ